MSELVARTGRSQQRYKDGCRLVAGYLSIYLSIHSFLFFLSIFYKITNIHICAQNVHNYGRCIPFKYCDGNGTSDNDVEVLMINSTSGRGLLFPKAYTIFFL